MRRPRVEILYCDGCPNHELRMRASSASPLSCSSSRRSSLFGWRTQTTPRFRVPGLADGPR